MTTIGYNRQKYILFIFNYPVASVANEITILVTSIYIDRIVFFHGYISPFTGTVLASGLVSYRYGTSVMAAKILLKFRLIDLPIAHSKLHVWLPGTYHVVIGRYFNGRCWSLSWGRCGIIGLRSRGYNRFFTAILEMGYVYISFFFFRYNSISA